MDDSGLESYNQKIEKICNGLKEIHDLLLKVNRLNGGLKRYHDIKNEIQELGWTNICAKYHPDVNIDDPSAFELFEFYKFVYLRIENKL